MEADPRGLEPVRCPNCGFANASSMKFCGKCGAKLGAEPSKGSPEGLAALHIATSLYLLLSAGFNTLVQASLLFLVPYLVSGMAGLYLGYEYHQGRTGGRLKAASAITIALGLAATSVLFILGFSLSGVIGPAWVLFVVNAWYLWKSRGQK